MELFVDRNCDVDRLGMDPGSGAGMTKLICICEIGMEALSLKSVPTDAMQPINISVRQDGTYSLAA